MNNKSNTFVTSGEMRNATAGLGVFHLNNSNIRYCGPDKGMNMVYEVSGAIDKVNDILILVTN